MPRNMSFMMTTKQMYDQVKFVTRRLGWKFAKPGMIVNACEKCQGLKKGESMVKIAPIRFVDCRWEPLNWITQEDCILEGFPEMTPAEFVDMFLQHNRKHVIEFQGQKMTVGYALQLNEFPVASYVDVHRIQFEFVNPKGE